MGLAYFPKYSDEICPQIKRMGLVMFSIEPN